MPGRFSPLIYPGARFGRLTVVKRIPGGKGKRARVLCHCDCGKEVAPDCSNLTNGNNKSCGCLNKDQCRERAKRLAKENVGCRSVKVGDQFDRLKVTGLLRKRYWLAICHCQCGTIKMIRTDALANNRTRSCGCLNDENRKRFCSRRNKAKAKYGRYSKTHQKTYSAWTAMKRRCYDCKARGYKDYGSKGIVICSFLKEKPQNLAKIIGVRKNTELTLDRFPVHDGHYTCGNCAECEQMGWQKNIRWATRKQQSENRGDFNVPLTAFGRTMLKSQWMEASGLSWNCLTKRLRRDWDIERALTTPDPKGNCLRIGSPPNV